MHDLIEKAGVSSAERGLRFGPRISEPLVGVSDDERMTGYAARKADLRRRVAGAGDEALMLFAADKLSEVRELRREPPLDHDGTGARRRVRDVRARRLRHHQRSLALLGERLPESPLPAPSAHPAPIWPQAPSRPSVPALVSWMTVSVRA